MNTLIKQFLSTFLTLLIASFILGSPLIYSDGYGYYHVGKNLVAEGSFVSNIKPDYYYYSGHTTNIYDDRYVTVYSSATSIFWWPFLTAAKPFDNGTIYDNYFKAFNGHSFADGIALQIAASFYATILIILLYKLLRDLKFSKKISILGTVISLVATYMFGYIFINTSYSHLFEALSLTSLLFCINRFRLFKDNRYLFAAGVSAGFLVLTRPANLVILIPVFFYLLAIKKYKEVFYFIAGGIPIALIYFLYNYDSFGTFLANGYGILWGEEFELGKFNLLLLLFSQVRGWFVYSPVIILAIIGLVAYCKKDVKRILLYIMPIPLLVLLYSFWPSWWAGDSLGQRFFLVLLPIIAIGISFFITKLKGININLRRVILVLIILLTFYSAGLLFLLRITDTTKLNEFNSYTAEIYSEVNPAERYTPFDVINYNLSAVSSGDFYKLGNKDKSYLEVLLGTTQTVVKTENINENSFRIHLLNNPYKKSLAKQKFKTYVIRNGNTEIYEFETERDAVLTFNCNFNSCSTDFDHYRFDSDLRTFKDEDLIHLNNQTSIRLESDDPLLFIDYRLEDYKVWFVK